MSGKLAWFGYTFVVLSLLVPCLHALLPLPHPTVLGGSPCVSTHCAAHMFDGKGNTYWRDSGAGPWVVELDFGSSVTIDQIRMKYFWLYAVRSFTLKSSNSDQGPWQNVASISSSLSHRFLAEFGGFRGSGRYWQFEVTHSSHSTAPVIYTLEFWGPGKAHSSWAAVLEDNPRVFWRFESPPRDLSANYIDLEYNIGGVDLNTQGPGTQLVAAEFGDGHVVRWQILTQVIINSGLQADGPMALECWVYPGWAATDHSRKQVIERYPWEIYIRSNKFCFNLHGVGALCSTKTIPVKTWSFLAAQWDGHNIKLYINGVVSDSLSTTSGVSPWIYRMRAYVGISYAHRYIYQFTGKVAEVAFFSGKVLSDDRIAAHGMIEVDPRVCLSYGLESYDCNCHQCHCSVCHYCRCVGARHNSHNNHTVCRYGSCPHCWCSPHCNCCWQRRCAFSCRCSTCCDKCHRLKCTNLVVYRVDSVDPPTGLAAGGTAVLFSGGTYSNTQQVLCRFGLTVVNGSFLSPNVIRCTSPPATSAQDQSVDVAISLDGGKDWTRDNVTFTYYSCPGGGTCSGHGTCNAGGSCTCDSTRYGSGCEHSCPGLMQAANGTTFVCNAHGSCSQDGVCVCDNGWTGATCNTPGNATCAPGYWGPMCANECPGGAQNPCSGHGRCDTGGKCFCNSGYFGSTCASSCPRGTNNVTCSGHGTCNNAGVCTCDATFVGNACGITCQGINQQGQPCNGRGQCSALLGGKCICQPQYYGGGCQGTCILGSNGQVCSGNGACSDGVCVCSGGYFGADCSKACPGGANNVCNGHGICNHQDGTCGCATGYFGAACDHTCPGGAANPCSNNGTCVNGVCQCDPGFSGADCSTRVCLRNCYGNGQCMNGRCVCNPGFDGVYCSQQNTTGTMSPYHGVLEFTSTSITVAEDVDRIVLWVARGTGHVGDITVAVNTSTLSAIHGVNGDYFVSTNTLSWQDGDDQPKPVNIDIIFDNVPEHDESFLIYLSNYAGGSVAGPNSTVVVTIKANNGTDDFVEVTFRMLVDITTIPQGTVARRNFVDELRTDIVSALSMAMGASPPIARNLVQVVQLTRVHSSAMLVALEILPDGDTPAGHQKAREMVDAFVRLVQNPSSTLYQGAQSQYIDISFMPWVYGSRTDPDPQPLPGHSSNQTRNLLIFVGVPVLVLVICLGCCYRKRKTVIDWLLYKLGNFRFRNMSENDEDELPTGGLSLQSQGDGHEQFDDIVRTR